MCGNIVVNHPIDMRNIQPSMKNKNNDQRFINWIFIIQNIDLLATSVASKTPLFRALNLFKAARRLF